MVIKGDSFYGIDRRNVANFGYGAFGSAFHFLAPHKVCFEGTNYACKNDQTKINI